MATQFIIHNGDTRKQKLSILINNNDDLLLLFNQFNKIKKIDTLNKAINRFEQIFNINFYKILLPYIFKWAMEYDIVSIPIMEQGETDTTIFTAKEVRYWLSNTFIMNIDSVNKEKYGELAFGPLYFGSNTGEEKLLCILCYFHMAINLDETRKIGFYRHIITENPKPLFKVNNKINTNVIIIHTNNMESVSANSFVNFSNKQLSYGITNSCTQEEILNACCPETYLALLFIESMKSEEIIIIKGARRFSKYTGFLNSFKWNGIHNDVLIQDQIGLDACTKYHFSTENVNRDIMKAYTGFKLSNNTVISTGLWGCGAFGGDIVHKFLQQLLAVSILSNVKLYFSTYGNQNIANKLQDILDFIDKNNITIKQLYENLCMGEKLGF